MVNLPKLGSVIDDVNFVVVSDLSPTPMVIVHNPATMEYLQFHLQENCEGCGVLVRDMSVKPDSKTWTIAWLYELSRHIWCLSCLLNHVPSHSFVAEAELEASLLSSWEGQPEDPRLW